MQRSARVRFTWVVACALVLAMLAAWIWYRSIDRNLSQPPPRMAGASVPTTPTSHVVIPVMIRRDGLGQLAAAAIPETLELPIEDIGKGQWWNFANLRFEGEVRRGPIRLSSVDDGVIVANAPLELHVGVLQGGARQDLRAGADATARMTLDVDPDWQLVPDVAIEYAWDERSTFTIPGLPIDFSPLVSAALDPALRELERTIATQLPQRVPLRAEMEQLWVRLHEPVRLSENPEIWLQPDPISVSMPPPTGVGDAYVLLLGIDARLRVVHGPRPSAAIPESLPPLQKDIAHARGVAIAAPIDIDYATLEQSLLRTLSSQPLQVTVPGLGTVDTVFKEFKVYPSAPGIVIGARVAVDTPQRWLDTHGWIYLQGKPVYDATSMQLRIDDLGFSRDLDNRLVSLLSVAVRNRIRGELARASTIDLSSQVARLRAQLDQRLNSSLGDLIPEGQLDPIARQLFGSRLRASGKVNDVRVLAVVPGKDAVTVVAQLGADLTLQLAPEANKASALPVDRGSHLPGAGAPRPPTPMAAARE